MSPWAITLTKPVPEAFEFSAFDWAEKISEEDQLGDCDAFLHEVVFLIDHYSCMGLSTGRFATRVAEKNSAKSRKSQTLTWPQVNKHSLRNFHGGLIEGIVVL